MPLTLPTYQIWSAPLVPVALLLTAGVILDRTLIVPIPVSLGATAFSLLAWFVFSRSSQQGLALTYLGMSLIGLGTLYHHAHRHYLPASDLSHFANHDGTTARIRGVVHSAPVAQTTRHDVLRSLPGDAASATTRFIVRAVERQDGGTQHWHSASGRVQVTVVGVLPRTTPITVGDSVELLGRLTLPEEPRNPGEFDFASYLRDQKITTTLQVRETEQVLRIQQGGPTSPLGLLARARGWGQETLARHLDAHHEIAAALLLGEGASMTGEAWEQYLRTGVIHVLAISGQHLVVLAGFFWFLARVLGVRRKLAAPIIAGLLVAYALLTGGRPPVMRAAWMVSAFAGGILLQRPIHPANTFALSWIGVLAVNPTDGFNAGCQLSFLAVAVLMWGMRRWGEHSDDALQRVLDEARPWYLQLPVQLGRGAVGLYAVNAAVWLAVAPLVAWHYHTISPVALLLGPPMVLLTSAALLTGFLFLLLGGWLYPLAWLTQMSLAGCDWLVAVGQQMPGAYGFVPDIPVWWLAVFYVGLLVGITSPVPTAWVRPLFAAGAGWLGVGLLAVTIPPRPGEFRCTFVAVGHGGCTVIETPNGQVTVYDAGATLGPEVTRRHIAPFLWSRGIRRIDRLILSHGDLDHFNGVPQLADRFRIARVMTTPSFAQRDSAAIQKTLAVLAGQGVDVEIVHTGMQWETDGTRFTVLHPPKDGPAGPKENIRSLVLYVQQEDWSMLLTGDLEDAGLRQVLARPAPRIDVLMAPHHGSDLSNRAELADWAKPRLVVSSQAAPMNDRASVRMYEKRGATYLATWPHGAITLRPTAPDAQVETYFTKLRLKPFKNR